MSRTCRGHVRCLPGEVLSHITTRQNNEPAGDQHAFHFHFHIFPRYKDDGYNVVQPSEKRLADPHERKEYAHKIKAALSTQIA